MQGAATRVQPVARFAPVGIAALDLLPEPAGVVHLLDVRDLMCGDIVEREGGAQTRRQEKLRRASEEHEPRRERMSFMAMGRGFTFSVSA